MRAGLIAVTVAAVLVALAGSGATSAALGAECAPPLSGGSVTFEYEGESQRFQVPEGVSELDVTGWGGDGGEYDNTGEGGLGGIVTATLPVTPRECLDVYVGGYGVDPNGGFGHGAGGGRGSVPDVWLGHPSAAGGGATALTRGHTPLIVAAGGGGGGGNGNNVIDVAWGGAGGDGAGGDGAGTPKGSNGEEPKPASGQAPLGGPGGGSSGINGEQGDSTGQQIWDPNLGAGGAGGGGHPGGGAGGVAVAKCEHNTCFVLPLGGGGGGGGSSYAVPQAEDATFSVDDDPPCPVDGGADACNGQLTLEWTVNAGDVATYGGSGQSVVIGSPLPRPLQARVTAADGNPLVDFDVTFTLPDSGPSARFDEGNTTPTTVTARTDANGVATTPPLIAGTEAGGWTATATASGAPTAALFALANEPAATATAMTSSANPSVAGEPVQFVAQVTSSPTSAPSAQGAVRFTVGGEPLGQAVAIDEFGRATSAPIALPPGDVGAAADFIPTSDFQPSGDTLTQRTDRTRSVLALSSSDNPSSSGQDVNFTADVTAVAPGTGTPTGTVQFTVDNFALGDPVQLTAGSASSPAVDLAEGEHVVRASYAGDSEHEPSGASFAQAVGADATATELSASPASGVVGQPVTLTATVKAADPSQTPTGSVTFEPDAAAPCEDVTLNAAGQASCVVEGPLTPGEHQVIAAYSGDTGFEPSSGHWTQPVRAARTAIALQVDPDPSVHGQDLRLHADVAAVAPGAGAPSGSVRFLVDGVAVAPPVTLRDGRGSSPVLASPPAGPHVVDVEYSGDGDFLPATGAVTQVVDRVRTLGTLRSSAPLAPFGDPVSFELRLDVVPPGVGPALGAVQFRVDGIDRGAPVPLSEGVATSPPLAGLAPGHHDVRASFTGDVNFAPSDATLVQRVEHGPAGPAPGRHGSGGTGSSPAVPSCERVLALTHVRPSGRRIHLGGVARPNLGGRRVAISDGRRVVARATVRRNGTFRTSARRPAAKRWDTTLYRASVARQRSAAEPLSRPLRLSRFRAGGRSAVRLVATMRGGRRHRLVILRRVGCSSRSQRVHSVRTNRAGRIQVALTRPATGVAVYRLRARAARTSSLPIVVHPASR